MNLFVIGMNYAPEHTGIAPYTTELCEYLTRRGHHVTVATTFPHYPEWKTHAAYLGKRARTEIQNGVTLKRRAVYLPKHPSARERILYDSSLAAGAWVSGVRENKIDLILGIEPPIQVGVVARLLAMQKRVPYVLWVQDLALEAAMAVGMMQDNAAIRAARRMEQWGYQGAARVAVISAGFMENLERKGVPREKLVLMPDWVDANFIGANVHVNGFRQAHGLATNALLVLHSGNMGAKQQLENVLRAAERLQAQSDIEFVLVGDGLQKQELIKHAQRANLHNVKFMPLVPHEDLPKLMAAADILLLNQHPDVVDAVIPSKLLTYMAAARPVVVAAHPESEAARQVRAANGGVWVQANEPEALANTVLQLAHDPQTRTRLGEQGRAFVRQNFSREPLLRAFEETLTSLVQ